LAFHSHAALASRTGGAPCSPLPLQPHTAHPSWYRQLLQCWSASHRFIRVLSHSQRATVKATNPEAATDHTQHCCRCHMTRSSSSSNHSPKDKETIHLCATTTTRVMIRPCVEVCGSGIDAQVTSGAPGTGQVGASTKYRQHTQPAPCAAAVAGLGGSSSCTRATQASRMASMVVPQGPSP
jgi:hypothetical protein